MFSSLFLRGVYHQVSVPLSIKRAIYSLYISSPVTIYPFGVGWMVTTRQHVHNEDRMLGDRPAVRVQNGDVRIKFLGV